MTFNSKKCEIFTNCIHHLGHVICPECVEGSTRKIDAVQRINHPTILWELRTFHGLCNVFRRFVPNFDNVVAPRNKKLRKGHLQTIDGLSNEKNPASETLKAELVEPRVPALQRSQGDYKIDTEA